MSNTIEKLYEGKLEPLKLVGKGNGEMRRIENLIERNKLKETLDSDKKEIFEKYVECMDEYLILIGEQAFCESRNTHYHKSRYHFLNLHSFFHGNHTVELRGFNSTLHAGKIRSYIVLALSLNHQALTQQKASTKKNQTENEKV